MLIIRKNVKYIKTNLLLELFLTFSIRYMQKLYE